MFLLLEKTDRGMKVLKEDGSYEEYDVFPEVWLKEQCLRHGSTMEGRMDAFREITGARKIPGVLISEMSGELYFPTAAYKHTGCVWINGQELYRYQKKEDLSTELTFKSHGVKAVIDYDVRTVRMQARRCAEFMKVIHPSSLTEREEEMRQRLRDKLL